VRHLSRFLSILLFGLCLLSYGCQEGVPRPSAFQPSVVPAPALVSVYLETSGRCSQDLSFSLASLEVLSDGLWLPLNVIDCELSSTKLQDQQTFLGATSLPEGQYSALRFRLKKPENSPVPIENDMTVEIPLSRKFTLARSESSCLFLEWVLRDCSINQKFSPTFHAHIQEQPLATDLLYVLCDESRTLYLVRADNHFVVASYGLPGRCGEIHVDSISRRLYILDTQQRLLHVFDAGTSRFIDRISLNPLVEPRYFVLDSQGSSAFVTDGVSDTILAIDLSTGQITGQQKAVIRPQRIIYFESSGSAYLAVASPQSQTVAILSSVNLQKIQEIRVGQRVDGILFHQGLIYVTEVNNNQVSVYDAISGQYKGRVSVGLQPCFLTAEEGGRVFVSNSGENSLSVLIPGQFVTARSFSVDQHPFVSVFSSKRQNLYVGYKDVGMISIYDVASERPLGEVRFAGSPFSLDILEW